MWTNETDLPIERMRPMSSMRERFETLAAGVTAAALGIVTAAGVAFAVTLLISAAAVSKEESEPEVTAAVQESEAPSCDEQTWPYIAQHCLKSSAKRMHAPHRVRVITPHTTAAAPEAVLAAKLTIAKDRAEREQAALDKAERSPRADQDTLVAGADSLRVKQIVAERKAPRRNRATVANARRNAIGSVVAFDHTRGY